MNKIQIKWANNQDASLEQCAIYADASAISDKRNTFVTQGPAADSFQSDRGYQHYLSELTSRRGRLPAGTLVKPGQNQLIFTILSRSSSLGNFK